jgi:chromosome segregation protein
MHIKKLEIAGFKSFVDRTVIHFDHDVLAIVGPNGCGKSNVVDAIRWCLGEQSAKHLRGRAMEDVIFNGSESRKAHGLAEVTITFDNGNPEYAASLPPEYKDYPEIAVTRRLFRDGTSEYLINKTQVRLRDITELFLGTGVGTKAYSIVEQGRIGQIVSARPEDRRLFLEEAAGITKYKQRRKMAERKMELTRQNLLRINDIVSEIDRNRASLKRQVAKAERFLDYRRELEDLVLLDASHRLLELTVTDRVEREGFDSASTAAHEARGKVREADAIMERAREESMLIELRTEEASQRAFEADNEVSGLHAEIERSRDRLEHLNQRLNTGNVELEGIAERTGLLRTEQGELEQRVGELSADERSHEADALSETEALSLLQAEEAHANEELMGLRRKSGELSAQAAAEEARLDGFEQRLTEGRTRRDRLGQERDKLNGELADSIARQHALERSVAELLEGKKLTQADRQALESELNELKGRQHGSERAVDTVKNELSLKRNRLRALEDLHRRLEGVGAGARALLGKDDGRVLGLVADRIEAPAELTEAVAGLLGTRLQAVVVRDREAGIELLAELAASERGRADVIAARPGYIAGGRPSWEAGAGVLGRLIDRLGFAESDEALVRALVGDAVLVETAAQAVALATSHAGLTVVALDGTVARPEGVVSGGSGDDVASAMLDQKREIHQLTDEVARLDAQATKLVADHTALRSRLTEVGTELERARQFAHEGELAHVTAEKDLARTRGDIERIEARCGAIEIDLEELDRSLESATLAEDETRLKLDEVKAQLEHLNHDLQRAEATAGEWRERVAAQSSMVTERKVRLAQVREQAEAARSSAERVAASLLELETRAERLNQELWEAAASYGETAGRIVLAREARADAVLRARDSHLALDEARATLEQVRVALSTQEAELKIVREGLETHDEALRRHEMAMQRNELELEHLLGAIRERFRGLDLRRVAGDYHARALLEDDQRRRIDELTQLIDRMGPVNLDAKAEYDDAEKRFHDLNDQKVDIEKALEELDHAIRHMNKESRRRFKETFDEVNALFKKTFGKLFRGGRAELLLTNPEDLLGSGVEIIAQPPGKKLGNIELMSGGEKALTAVSLIFAIFQHRPSPFCVLDEVDAPLDEGNVVRYNEMIRSMTGSSQFILITHIKKTMQSADVLYGVTMGEPGVSRIVSVKVNENAVSRSDSLAAQAADKQHTVRSTTPAEAGEPEAGAQVA